ncbi:MAG: hypothetical protein Q4B95_00375 [Lonepinella koalarum]|nr:hypothetical protein [Lonepinella koalarum]
MKLTQLLPTTIASLMLAACSTTTQEQIATQKQVETEAKMQQAIQNAEQQAKQVAMNIQGNATIDVTKITDSSKSIVYRCLNGKSVTATYSFQGNDAKTVNLVLKEGKKLHQIPTLIRHIENKDFASFIGKGYIWNVDSDFSLATAMKGTGGMLTLEGKDTDQILAKLCDIDHRFTQKLNK